MQTLEWNVFYIPEHNAKGGPHEIEILRSWNANSKYKNK